MEETGLADRPAPAPGPARAPGGTGRGRLRIFLGATPGSGKTYAMLREGHDRLGLGQDVVVAFVEHHNRPRTIAALDGLEVLPRRCRDWHGRPCEDMDLDAVLARHPQVALVDELAHTNLPGARNEKRWQDVEELRSRGIDVLTTVNIQAVESVKDLVETITGIPVRETIPDHVIDGADEIQFIDISPEALRKRMKHGNIYARDKVDIALANFFRPGNLAALREIALRQIAQSVGRSSGAVMGAPQDVLVAVSGRPSSEPLIRRGARMARRFGGFCHVLRVVDPHLDVSPEIVARHRQIAEQLGCRWSEVSDRDIDDAVVESARELGVQHVLIGEAAPSGLVGRFRKGLVDRLVEELPDVSLHIIAREDQRPRTPPSPPQPAPHAEPDPASPGTPVRGSLRIYLGYARGCGITTTMLEEARRRHGRGTDVVVASVLLDGHPETRDHLAGLELLGGPDGPAARAVLDVPALLARRPAVACIDELTAADSEGRQAATDLETILDAGITVIATLHLVELELARTELSARLAPRDRPAITVDVLGLADEVEIVDVTPEVLIERVERGEVVVPGGPAAARAGDYRHEVLAELRALAFRVIAEHTDRRLVAYMRERKIDAPWEARPRVLLCLPPREGMEWLVRRSARLARAIDADLTVATVLERDGDPPAAVTAYQALTTQQKGNFVALRSRNVAQALAEYARRELVTEVIVTRGQGGQVRRSRLRELLRTLSDVDVHVLSVTEA